MPRILLVEDNEMNRDMLTRRLLKKGFEVVIAEDGNEGVKLAREQAPELILMDMSLPVMDGWEATRLLKAAPETRTIPILGLSAHAMTGDREKALKAGCDDYDTKPIDFNRLMSKIQSLLNHAVDS
ncbi:MAG: response regulator [Nitrospinae bacterium]|nr:response regulator [Nitrospinota bacterium]